MRILFWTDTLNCGGKERQLTELAKGVVRLRYLCPDHLAVLSMEKQGHFDSELEQAGVRIVRLCRTWRWDPLICLRGRRLLRTIRPDVIFSFSVMGTLYAALTPKPGPMSLVDFSLQNALPIQNAKQRALYWLNFRAADLVVANSHAGLAAKRAPKEKSAVLQNGFDFNRLKNLAEPAAVRQSLGIKASRVVGMVGRFTDVKDWRSFLEAAEIVRRSGEDVCFVCVGSGKNLQAYRAEFGARDYIRFTGWRSDVESLANAFDVGVLCSNPDLAQEGIPNVVMEYMALGVPALVTAGGGIRELVVDGATGFILEPRDPKALAEKVRFLLTKPETAKLMGQRGRQRIRTEFSMEGAVKRLMGLCDSLVAPSLE